MILEPTIVERTHGSVTVTEVVTATSYTVTIHADNVHAGIAPHRELASVLTSFGNYFQGCIDTYTQEQQRTLKQFWELFDKGQDPPR